MGLRTLLKKAHLLQDSQLFVLAHLASTPRFQVHTDFKYSQVSSTHGFQVLTGFK